MMTIPMPQLRIARAAEFDAMTRRFPMLAKPSTKAENNTTSAKVTPTTTYSSRLPLRRPPLLIAGTSTTETYLVPAFCLKDLPRLGGRRDFQRQFLEHPPYLEHLRRAGRGELAASEKQAVAKTHPHMSPMIAPIVTNEI